MLSGLLATAAVPAGILVARQTTGVRLLDAGIGLGSRKMVRFATFAVERKIAANKDAGNDEQQQYDVHFAPT